MARRTRDTRNVHRIWLGKKKGQNDENRKVKLDKQLGRQRDKQRSRLEDRDVGTEKQTCKQRDTWQDDLYIDR
jgi:hypothetical protein